METRASSAGRKTRLCIVTPNHWQGGKGGAEYQIQCLLDALIPTGRYDIQYLARHVASDYEPAAYGLVRLGDHSRTPRFGYLHDARPLYSALRRLDPDVIYQRVGCGYTAVAAHYARRHGKRLIWHVAHDSDVMPGQALSGRNPVRRFLEKKSIEYGIRHATRIVVQTFDQARLLQENYGRRADAVIRNFHPLPAQTIDKAGPLTVLWVANFKPWKHPEKFVRLAMRLRDLQGVRFAMVGAIDGHPSREGWNRDLLRDIEAAPNLAYLGEKSQDEVNELLGAAHLFVNTSAQEGFPNTFIQAWMRGVPVVSAGVNPDGILERERIGICTRSEEALAEAVRQLVTDRERLNEYARAARAYAAGQHSFRNIESLQKLIDTDHVNADPPVHQ